MVYFDESELIFKRKLTHVLFQDLEGQVFNRLTVIGYAGKKGIKSYWYCRCKCKNITRVGTSHLKRGDTKSCGCLIIERTKETQTKHGHCRDGKTSLTYKTWKGMLQRCRGKHSNYGGRGIIVCKRWKKYENFLQDMGERPEGLTLDRIDNNGNYCPENCRWANKSVQANNTSKTVFLTFRDKTLSISQWAEKMEINYTTLHNRLYIHHWSIEKALMTKVR